MAVVSLTLLRSRVCSRVGVVPDFGEAGPVYELRRQKLALATGRGSKRLKRMGLGVLVPTVTGPTDDGMAIARFVSTTIIAGD